jgi:hypothetical protein
MQTQSDFATPEVRINLAIGTLLRYFNFLELNLGLCIRHLQHPEEVERSHRWLARSSIQEKIARFAKLVRQRGLVTNEHELEAWCQFAAESPSLRNFYAHAIWEYLPLRKGAPVTFRVPPWRSESIKGSNCPKMTVDGLEADADALRTIFEKFMRLRKTYGV